MLILILLMFSIHRKLCLALKKVQFVKITPPQAPTIQQKNLPEGNLPPPLTTIWKTLVVIALLHITATPKKFLYYPVVVPEGRINLTLVFTVGCG